jgi:hypothetical protein
VIIVIPSEHSTNTPTKAIGVKQKHTKEKLSLLKEMDYLSKLKTHLTSEKSYNNYIFRIKKLEELTGKSLDYILLHPEEIYPLIKEQYPNINTRKNILTPILTIFKVNPELIEIKQGQSAKETWKLYHDDMNTLQIVEVKQNKMPRKLKDNYVSTEELELKRKELKKGDPHDKLDSSQRFLLITLLFLQQHNRHNQRRLAGLLLQHNRLLHILDK